MRITLGTASLAQIEQGGRNYEANLLNRYLSDTDGYEDEQDDDDLQEPVEVITERDMHPAHWEGVEGYLPSQDDEDQAEAMYVDYAERVW